MQGKMSRYRNYIMGFVLTFVVVFTGVCSNSFVSHAETYYAGANYTWSSSTPDLTLELSDWARTGSYYYEPEVQTFSLSKQLISTKYYRLFMTFDLNSWPTVNFDKLEECTNSYFVYAGEKYYFNGRVLSIIVPGNGNANLSLGLESTITLNAAAGTYASGYMYYQGDLALSAYELTEEEVIKHLGVDSLQEALNEQIVLQEKILEEEEEQTSWLEKIWNSIQEFFGSSDEEKQKGDDFKENSANQNDELGDLITDSEVEKPDIEDITDDIDTNIDLNSVSNFGEFLSCIIDNEYVSRCLLMVGVMLIMGYVLFGKRG